MAIILAEILRICAVLPVSPDRDRVQDVYMFTVHCPRHGSEVLLPERHITGLEQAGDHMTVRWVCWCGHHGSHQAGRRRQSTNII